MKKKVSPKQLCLTKETIVHLSHWQIEIVKGGCVTLTLEYTCNLRDIEPPPPPKLSENTCVF